MKKAGLFGYLYDLSADYDVIVVDNIPVRVQNKTTNNRY